MKQFFFKTQYLSDSSISCHCRYLKMMDTTDFVQQTIRQAFETQPDLPSLSVESVIF